MNGMNSVLSLDVPSRRWHDRSVDRFGVLNLAPGSTTLRQARAVGPVGPVQIGPFRGRRAKRAQAAGTTSSFHFRLNSRTIVKKPSTRDKRRQSALRVSSKRMPRCSGTVALPSGRHSSPDRPVCGGTTRLPRDTCPWLRLIRGEYLGRNSVAFPDVASTKARRSPAFFHSSNSLLIAL